MLGIAIEDRRESEKSVSDQAEAEKAEIGGVVTASRPVDGCDIGEVVGVAVEQLCSAFLANSMNHSRTFFLHRTSKLFVVSVRCASGEVKRTLAGNWCLVRRP